MNQNGKGSPMRVVDAVATWFEQIGRLLMSTGLPPEPAVYDVLWRYVRDDDHELSLAIDRALTSAN